VLEGSTEKDREQVTGKEILHLTQTLLPVNIMNLTLSQHF
jgi:hypothetical protein